MIPTLSAATLTSALITIWAKSPDRLRLVYVLKPLTTVLIPLLALQTPTVSLRSTCSFLLAVTSS
jgi:hypothetical protein